MSNMSSTFTIDDLREIAYRGSYRDSERALARELLALREAQGKAVAVVELSDYFVIGEERKKAVREQYEAALSASKKPEWNGEGLPPVGCECEFQHRNAPNGLWHPTTIRFSSRAHIIYVDTIDDCEACVAYDDTCQVDFRPIRSEADRKRDEAVEAMRESLGHASGLIEVMNIYRAIAAGKIPGIRIE